MKVRVLGRGKVGTTLARALRDAGIAVSVASGRAASLSRERTDVWILAVPDARIRETAERVAAHVDARQVVFHCAGARGPDELAPCRARGAAVAGFHPLVSFADARARPSLAGATFVVDGDARAVRAAHRLVRALSARCVALPVLGPAYHAAAALVANGAAALALEGVEILRTLGFDRREAERAVGALLGSVAHNVARVGVPAALTGPVVRGDAETVARHLDALRRLDAGAAEAYASVQPMVLHAARRAGLDANAAARMARVVSRAATPRKRRVTSRNSR